MCSCNATIDASKCGVSALHYSLYSFLWVRFVNPILKGVCAHTHTDIYIYISLSLSLSLGTVLFKQLNFLTDACFQEDAARVFRQCFGKAGDLTISVEADGAQRDFKVWSCLLAEWSDAWHRLALALYGVACLELTFDQTAEKGPVNLKVTHLCHGFEIITCPIIQG